MVEIPRLGMRRLWRGCGLGGLGRCLGRDLDVDGGSPGDLAHYDRPWFIRVYNILHKEQGDVPRPGQPPRR